MSDNEIYKIVLENFPDGIIIADTDNKIIFVNAAAEKIRHISRADKIGKSIFDCHKPESREKVQRALTFLNEKHGTFKRMVTDHEGGSVYENTYQIITTSDNKPLGSIVVSKDITEKTKIEEENLNYNRKLQLEITGLTDRLSSLFLESLTSLVCTLEAKDIYTKGHSERVTEICRKFVYEFFGTTPLLSNVELAARLHDIGKIGINESILNKPDTLTSEEQEMMRQHPLIMEQILSPFINLKDVITIAKHHHERFDGTGYPDKLSGNGIPVGSRILALADTYDAMTSTRPYRKALDAVTAIQEIQKNLGTQFDPDLGKKFIELIETGTL